MRFAVIGHPIAHSRSPQIHSLFARQFGHQIEYGRVDAAPEDFVEAVRRFQAEGGQGMNVTVPHKVSAAKLCNHLSDRASLAGAVNTLKFEGDGAIFGDNTDGAGLVHDLEHNLGLVLKGSRILLLGAGGAARGIVDPLLRHHPALLCVANRTEARARELAGMFRAHGPIEGIGLSALKGKHFDLVIHATSAGLEGDNGALSLGLPETLFARGAVAYDLMYGPKARPFLSWATLHGIRLAADGLGMLVEQAAESYVLWHGVRPETRAVIDALRQNP